MSKKKLLFIHHGQGIGGAAISLLQLVQGLQKKHDVQVLFLQASVAVQMFAERSVKVMGPLQISDFSHTKVWWYRWYHPHHLLKALFGVVWALWHGPGLLKNLRADVVHLNTSSLWAWGLVCWRLKIPVYQHVREPLAPGYFGIRSRLTKQLVGFYSRFILPICRHDAQPWSELKKTQVLYNAVDPVRFDASLKSGERVQKQVILFLGGLSEVKGTDFLLKVFNKIAQKNSEVELWIAGAWQEPEKVWWQKVLAKFGIFPPAEKFWYEVQSLLRPVRYRVKILGVRQDIPELLRQASLITFPCKQGHFARPVIEAALLGVPCVVSKTAPMDEIMIHHATGLALPYGQVELWSNKILALLEDKRKLAQFGENAQRVAKQYFLLPDQINAAERLYEKVGL